MFSTKKIKKVIVFCIVTCLLAISNVSVFAENLDVKVNGDYVTAFNKLLIVNDGTVFLPLRLAFTSAMDNEQYPTLVTYMSNTGDILVAINRKDETGKFNEEGNCVLIHGNEFICMNFTPSDYTEDGKAVYYNASNPQTLKHPIRYENLDASGDRTFLSLDDLNDIILYLTDSDNYQVNVYKAD